MNEAVVSIIVPVYKTEKYLRECIDSILVQTLKNIEIVLVDDGSPDACPEICDEYEKKDPRVKVVHKKNEGLLKARMSGVARANAQYIGFVDSDDVVCPDYFERLYIAAKGSDIDLACCSLTFWHDAESRDALRYQKAKVGFSGLYRGDSLSKKVYPYLLFNYAKGSKERFPGFMVTKLYKKQLIDSAFEEVANLKVHIYEDVAVSFYCALSARSMVFIPDSAGYMYRQRDGSILHSLRSDYFEDVRSLLIFLREIIDSFDVDDDVREAFHFYSTGRALLMLEWLPYSDVSFKYLWKASKELALDSLWLNTTALTFFSHEEGIDALRKAGTVFCRSRKPVLLWLLMCMRHIRYLMRGN